jgi:uncharacterized protein
MNDKFPDGLIAETSEGITLRLHLQPRSSRTEICGIQGDELKVRVTAPPVDDAANRLCIEFFAKMFRLPKSAVSIVSGHKSRHKKIHISGPSLKEAVSFLQLSPEPSATIDKTIG